MSHTTGNSHCLLLICYNDDHLLLSVLWYILVSPTLQVLQLMKRRKFEKVQNTNGIIDELFVIRVT